MGGGSNSYLYRALVVDHPLAVSASAAYQGTSLDPTQFSVAASPRPGVDFSTVEQAIDGVIADVAQNPARAEDLERVKTQLIAEAIYAQVWRRADLGPEHRRYPKLAGPHSRCHGRTGP